MPDKNDYRFDVAVALIFFNRPDVLEKTFNAIKAAKPSKLFLIQDAARVGNIKDIESVQKCRSIVENIDWDCTVIKDYADDNMGCGMRVYTGITAAFNKIESLMIIEDDCVPSIGFFQFCQEMLEYYKNDTRIHKICGMNNLGVYERTPYSYVFAKAGSLWGWATWKRAWETIEYNMEFLNDEYTMNNFINSFPYKFIAKDMVRRGKQMQKQLSEGKRLTSWSYQGGMNVILNSRLNIIPKVNLVSNIGLHPEATNGSDDIRKVPKGMRSIYNMQTYDIDFPIRHPKYVVRDVVFERKIFRLMGNGHPIVRMFRKMESFIRRLLLGDFAGLYKGVMRRSRKSN